MWRTLILSLIPLFITITACSSRDEDSSFSFRTYQENGISIAETSGSSKYDEPLFRFEEILTLNQNPDVEESLLFQAVRYQMDENGQFYVMDFGNRRIAVFDEHGEFSHSIGQAGQGPGEFRSISLVSVRDGYVTVLDDALQRTSVFDYRGRFIKHISFGSERISSQSQVYEGPGATKILLKRIYHREQRPKMITSWRGLVFSAEGDTLCCVETAPVQEAIMIILKVK